MPGKIEGRRRNEQQRMRWLNGIINSMNMSLSKLWEIVKDGESWHATFHGVTKSQTWLSDWTTTNNNNNNNYTNNTIGWDLQCARLWAHHVINSHNYFLWQGLVPSPFYSWRNWEPTKVINLLSLTGHVWMQELDCEESWALTNWCFWTVVLEQTHWESLGLQGNPTSTS